MRAAALRWPLPFETSMACAACLASAQAAQADSFLDAAGPVAAAQVSHLRLILILMAIVVVPVFAATPWLVRRYRYGRARGDYRPEWKFSLLFEVLAWGVPFLVVIVLGTILWERTHQLDPYLPVAEAKAPPVVIDVIGYDWKWLFIYPEQGVASVGEMAFPADRPVKLNLTSDTVMQSLLIPRLGSQIYAMKGMRTQLNLAADGPGRFEGRNTQYNGKGFSAQSFTAVAMRPGDFESWVAQARAQGLPFDEKARAALEHKGTKLDLRHALGMPDGTVVHFAAAPTALFDKIAGMKETGE
ncbi:cytochrome ubiquinol oxidase subunit II [Thioclava atlantica]|uniref:Cytochrome c oxidase subunit II n=1 Tax=Thioclava atlantica TaxID=1317124 RepID=A0A085TU06_9RHOB|nr:cytochrome ubiquinol oxidase subunit II [Thioclava atlantica]KFE34203.1 cytochrome c oxidase subunit II [Thioclava atlantica]